MTLTRDEIEQKRAEAMAARANAQPASRGSAPTAGPNQSRLTLARAAIRPEMKGRVMLSGPAGAGKTYTAHVIAEILVGPTGRILTIDSEKESSLTYADVFTFEQLPWNPPYDPTALSLTLKEAAATYDCVIVDSFSHFWRKQGGVLDIAGDNVRGWKAARPIQENLIETLLDVDCHVIVCCRSKMEHLIEDKGGGKIAVTKAGIKAQQDDDLEYEVNVALELDMQHVLHIVKSRTNAVPVGSQFLAGLAGDFAQQYREWLKSGEPVADKTATDLLRVGLDEIADEGDRRRLKAAFLDRFGRPEFLLVSRLPEAQQWVVDAVGGVLPVDRAEDDVPPEPSGSPQASGSSISEASAPSAEDSSTSTTNGQGASQSERQPEPAASGQTGQNDYVDESPADEPHVDSIEHRADVEGPAVFNGDTGHCSACGAPIWYSAEAGDHGSWLHAEGEADDVRCPVGDGIHSTLVPAGDDVDVDALYAAAHPPLDVDALRVTIEAEVDAMTPTKVLQSVKTAGLSINGTPKTIRKRWLAHRLATEVPVNA